jgi:hypothetical protein
MMMMIRRKSTMRQCISVIAKTDETLKAHQVIVSFYGPRGGAQVVRISLKAARHLREQLDTAIEQLIIGDDEC